MGNCNFANESQESTSTISKNNFIFHYVIGKGGFGKVWKVEFKKLKQIFAMKEMAKSKILSKKSVQSVLNEKQLLSQLNHSFLVNMTFAFQDKDNLYLVLDYLTGGDLRYHISKHKKFTEEQTKFFCACILEGLQYLHLNGIIHRDIKPENLVFDEFGYIKITDLGIARIWKPENNSDTSGTPGYMAPEVMCRQNHGVAVDYFALGVICYECMIGRRPYNGRSRKEIRDQILSKQIQIKKSEIPVGWSIEAADFVNQLIQRKPMNRLGLNGPSEVKSHPWLSAYPWEKLRKKEIMSPFIPPGKEDNFDARYANSNRESNPDLIKQNELMLRRNSVQSITIQQRMVQQKQNKILKTKKDLFQGYDMSSSPESLSNNTERSTSPKKNLLVQTIPTASSPVLKPAHKFQNQQILTYLSIYKIKRIYFYISRLIIQLILFVV